LNHTKIFVGCESWFAVWSIEVLVSWWMRVGFHPMHPCPVGFVTPFTTIFNINA